MALVIYQQPISLISSQNESLKESETEDIGKYSGLSNQGATCYLNGLLQTLFMTPEFRKAIFTWIYNSEKDGKEELCIPLQLQRLFGMLQLSNQRSVDTIALTKSFGWDSSEVFQQQDVQELTRVLFDALEESFKGTEVENIIDELYAGELIDYLRCIDVEHESERKDKFLDFSLAIVPFGSNKAMHSLTECIEMFLRPEILNGDNKYYAEKFERKVDALKGLKFGRLPQIMSVQLKRFVYDFSGVEIIQKKLNDVVKFPMVLDMNKYVASKRRHAHDKSHNNAADGEEIFDPNEEFETFLREQMDILNAETKISDEGSSGVCLQDIDEGCINTSSDALDQEEPDDDMPPLVDYTGMRAPDQIAADATKAAKEVAAAKEKVLYGSMSEEAVHALLTERGEWIYELYAVLIHSGAISGGHYYAYIKDLETQRWQNFNDSSVSPIDEQTVQQAWGETINVTNYGSYSGMNSLYNRGVASSASTTRLSSANAYMLMYRQVTPSSLGKVVFPSADSVPQYIQDLVRAEEKKRLDRLAEEEEMRNRLRVKVWWEDKESTIITSKVVTYRDFLRSMWTQLNIGPHLMEQDSVANELHCVAVATGDSLSSGDVITSESPWFSRFRLRYYNQYTKSRTEILDVEVSGDKTLHELGMNDYRPLVIETRSSLLEDYEEFFKDGVSLQVAEFLSDKGKFGEVRSVRLPRGSTVGDLKVHLVLRTPFPVERMQLFKMVPMGQVDARMEVLNDDSKRLREDLNLHEGYKVFVEEMPLADSPSPAWQAVMKSRSQLNILVNKPPSTAFEFLVEGDLRWKVSELRSKVLEVLELAPEVDIRMFKVSSRGQELREDGLSLSSNAVYAGMNIFVSLGKALRVGVHQLCVMQFTPTEGRAGVVLLPQLVPEEEEVSRSALSVTIPRSSADVKKGWDIKATLDVNNLHKQIDELSSAETIEPPQLVFAHPSSSVAANTSAMYRMCGDRTPPEDVSICEDVAFQGLLNLTTAEVCQENIHNLIHTKELTVDGRNEQHPQHAVPIAPIMMSDSRVNLVSPVTVACVVSEGVSSVQTVVCSECSAEEISSVDLKRAEVEPSGFGELTVKNQSPVSEVFESLEGLGDICVETSTPIADLRQTILDRLIAANKLPQGASPRLVRLRDKVGSNPGKVLRDGRTLGESKVYLFDQKSIAVQLLDMEEDLSSGGTDDSELGDALIHIQRWRRSTWSMDERFEVLLRGGMTVRDVARALGQLTDIPVDSMLALVVQRDSELYLSELQMKSPTRNYGRGWFSPGKETKLLKYMSHELKVQDGDLLILQDSTEPLRELLPADLRSIAIVEAAANYPYIDSYPVSFGPQVYDYGTKFSSPSGGVGRSTASTGVKIKTHQERLRESEKMQADADASTPGDDVAEGPVSLTEHTAEEREIEKHGGMALFADMI